MNEIGAAGLEIAAVTVPKHLNNERSPTRSHRLQICIGKQTIPNFGGFSFEIHSNPS